MGFMGSKMYSEVLLSEIDLIMSTMINSMMDFMKD